MLAVQGNKQIQIEEKEKDYYLVLGFDVAEVEDGELKIVENSPSKTVTYAEHKRALDRIAELEAENEGLKSKGKIKEALDRIAELEAENKALKNPDGK